MAGDYEPVAGRTVATNLPHADIAARLGRLEQAAAATAAIDGKVNARESDSRARLSEMR